MLGEVIMKVPFFDLQRQYTALQKEVVPVVNEVLKSCAYIGGRYVQGLEEKMAEYIGVTHAVGCANGTEALTLALRACNIQPGDEVITTPFTFFATAEAIASVGAIPVFVDIKETDYTIDPICIEKKITSKTKAILPVHIFGAPCEMSRIIELAKLYRLKVIEDSAQAIGTEYQGKQAGAWGDIACFSFYPTKNLGAYGDGGMLTTNDDELYTILLALREHGAAKNGAKAREFLYGKEETPKSEEKITDLYNPYKYFNYLIGYNSRLDAIQAAILQTKLPHLKDYNAARKSIAEKYTKNFSNLEQIICPSVHPDGQSCWHQYAIRTEKKYELCNYLQNFDIGCGTFYPIPLHLQKAFDYLGYQKADLPIAEKICSQTVCLPIFPELTAEETDYIIECVQKFSQKEG